MWIDVSVLCIKSLRIKPAIARLKIPVLSAGILTDFSRSSLLKINGIKNCITTATNR